MSIKVIKMKNELNSSWWNIKVDQRINKELLSADLNSYAEKGKILPVGHVYWTFFQWGILGLYQVGNTWVTSQQVMHILGLYQVGNTWLIQKW